MARTNFDSLTKAEQRVVIAKDLIARLRAKNFIARSGTYLSAPLTDKELRNEEAEIRDVLKGKKCKGCQIGGLFLCAVDRHNRLQLSTGAMDDSNSMRRYLSKWFTKQQLFDVEEAFEGGLPFMQWADRHNDDERMTLIAQNIIKNKGRFVPSQLLKT